MREQLMDGLVDSLSDSFGNAGTRTSAQDVFNTASRQLLVPLKSRDAFEALTDHRLDVFRMWGCPHG